MPFNILICYSPTVEPVSQLQISTFEYKTTDTKKAKVEKLCTAVAGIKIK